MGWLCNMPMLRCAKQWKLMDSYAANCVQVINRQVALAGVRRASIELFLFKEIRNKEKLFLEKVSFFKFVVRNFQLYIQII